MFDSIKHWFDSLNEESKLFKHPEDETIHIALASILYHLISNEHQESSNERHQFSSILKDEFDLDSKQIDHLYHTAKSSNRDLILDLKLINEHLYENPATRMKFMTKLNRLVEIGGILDSELEIFNQALHVIFPEVKSGR